MEGLFGGRRAFAGTTGSKVTGANRFTAFSGVPEVPAMIPSGSVALSGD
ncbi:MAG: hypothetical protein LBQ12_08370 [Deltaproteobacteria bacterium]|nr:hypothetical protein [Deltaproteobacteria bacterium]